MEAIKDMIRKEEFVDMVDEVIGENNSFYYGDRDESGKRAGTGVAVYEDGYFYYGEYADDVRNGHGTIMSFDFRMKAYHMVLKLYYMELGKLVCVFII